MSAALAVIAPHIGARSETFILRHMRDLLPGRTASIGQVIRSENGADDSVVPEPFLDLGRGLPGGPEPAWRGLRAMARTFKMNPESVAVGAFLVRHRVQVLMAEYLHFSIPWLVVARRLGIRFFVHAHGVDASAFLRDGAWRRQYTEYNRADGVIVVSHAMRERLRRIGIRDDRLHLIPCGVDVPEAPPQRHTDDEVRCLAVGRMVTKKAPIMLLDAFRRAADEIPSLHLDYVGSGELLPAAAQFVSAMNLSSRVTLHGEAKHSQVQNLMRRAHIFIQHSIVDPRTGDAEGLPVAVLEAMANALPVVATRHEGIVDAIPDDTVGLLVAEGDTGSMGEQIVTLAQSPELRTELGATAWKRAKNEFSWPLEKDRLLKLFGLHQDASSS